MWTFADGEWPPLIRLDLGDRLKATPESRLPRAEEVNVAPGSLGGPFRSLRPLFATVVKPDG